MLFAQGYEPTGQHYVEGEWPLAMAVVATLLLVFVIGAFLWAYLLVKHPSSSLTVTYVHRAVAR